jgi:Type IV secretion system pilin
MKYNILFFVSFVCLFLPATSHAGDFVNLVGVPGIDSNGLPNLNEYINALYRLSISIAALLAVIKIVIAGAKYMLSDIVTHKEDAKKDIQGALIGLLIVIGAIIILNTVNSDLTNLDLTIATTTVQQGPTVEEIIARQQQAIQDRAEELGSTVGLFQCESVVGVNNFVMLDGEDEEQACRRICQGSGSAFRGRFIDNDFGTTDQCEYVVAEAAQCNPNSSWTCCDYVLDGTWYAGHNQCLTNTNDFEQVFCSRTGPRGSVPDCSLQISECTAAGNRVISQQGTDILCSTDSQRQAEAATAAQEAADIEACENQEGGGRWNNMLNVCETGPAMPNGA